MRQITRLLTLTLCLLSVSLSVSHRVKRNVHGGGYGGSCFLQPNILHPPACFWLLKYKHPTRGGASIVFLGNDEIMNYAGTSDLTKTVSAGAVQSNLVLQVNPLKYKGKPLYGWFHVKIQSNDNTFPLTWVFAQGETEYTEAAPAGSFVPLNASNWGKSCQNDQVEKKTSIPCYFTQEPFPLTHNSFARYLPSRKVYSYSMFFRLDAPVCDVINSQNGIYFRTLVMNEKTRGKVPAFPTQSLIYVEDKFYGGADPAPPFHASNVECSGAIKDADWVKDEKAGYDLATAIPYDTCIDNICEFVNSYEGRCSVNQSHYNYGDTKWWAHPGYTHYCFTLKSSRNDSDWPELEQYIRTVENYTQDCPNCSNTVVFLTLTGIPVKSDIGEFVWASRQGHSVFMVIAVIFFYPVATFVARYYKETYMNKRVMVNLHFWYTVHIYLSILLVIALVNGLTLAIYGRKFYGYSTSRAARAHVIIGYLTLFFALVGVVSNGIRLRTPCLRYISIITHFVSGALFYICSLISVASSMIVPGSPSGGDDLPPGWQKEIDKIKKVDDVLKIETRFPPMILVLILWISFDVAMHVFSTLKFRFSDWQARRKVFPRRRWIFSVVPIPLAWADDTKDFDGSAFRKFLLMIYILVSGIITLILVLWLSFVPNDNRNLGKMRYTHKGGFADAFSLIDDTGGDGHVVSS